MAGAAFGDQVWFYHIVLRYLEGDVLYRDVFLGVGPLSVEVAAIWLRLAGTSLLAMKALQSIVTATTIVLVLGWAHRRRFEWHLLALLGTVLWVFVPFEGGSLYKPLAVMFLVGAFRVIDDGAPGFRAALLSGLLSGLAASTKHTIGLAGLLASTWTVFDRPADGASNRAVTLSGLAGGFFAGLAVPLFPFLGTDAFLPMWEFAAAGKEAYVRLSIAQLTPSLRDAQNVLFALLLCGVLAVPILFKRWRQALHGQVDCLYRFALLVTLAVIVRPNRGQLAPLIGLLALAEWKALGLISPTRLRWVVRAATVGMWIVALFLLGRRVSPLLVSPAAHPVVSLNAAGMQGLTMDAVPGRELMEGLHGLGPGSGQANTFFLMRTAAFGYRLGGYRNPTRYDYPTVPGFSRHGEAEIVTAIQEQRIERVAIWVGHESERCETESLEGWVRSQMVFKSRVGPFDVFAGTAAAAQ